MTNAKFRNLFMKYSRLLVLILLVVFFAAATKTFWGPDNWGNVSNIVLQQAPFTILLAICMTLVIVLKGFDLSIGSAVALISCVAGMVLNKTYNPWLAILAALILGAVIGVANGILVAYVEVPTFIVTFSMQWILRGIAMVLLGGKQIYDFGPTFRNIFTSSRYTFLILMAVIAILMALLLSKTVFGREVYATGTNQDAARMSGIRVKRVYIMAFLINGLIIAFTSVLYIANLGTAEPIIGENFPMTAIAATLVGGTAVSGGSGKVSNAVIGSLIMLVLTNGMIHLGVPSEWQQVMIGAIIVLSVVAERGMQKISVETV